MTDRHKGLGGRTRILHSLSTKLEVLKHCEKGKTNKEISLATGLPKTTIHDIRKKADVIRAMAKKGGTNKVNVAALVAAKPKTFSSDAKNKVLAGKVNGAAFVTARQKPKTFSANANRMKKNPYYHSLATKLEVLRRHERGENNCDIGRAINISPSTVRDMLKVAAKIKAAAKKVTTHKTLANKKNMTIIVKDNSNGLFVAEQKKIKTKKKVNVKGQFTPHPLSTKIEVVRRFESGQKINDIARDMGLARSTVFNITRKAERVKAAAKMCDAGSVPASQTNGVVDSPKDIVMENMERLLKIWIDEQLSQPGVLTDDAIQRKALSLWKFVWDSLGPEDNKGPVTTFTASTAWLREFKKGITFRQAAIVEVEPRAVPSPINPKPDVITVSPIQRGIGVAKGFSSLLRAKIEVGGYTPRHVINMDDMGLFWKKFPANTIIDVSEKAGQWARASRDQFSLMVGANATGDLKLKPLLVYHMESPRSLRGYIKEYLPVLWRSHPQGRVVSALCQNYVVDYVSHRCREYAMQHNLKNKFLLLVGNGPAFPPTMDDWADNIEVMFVPTMSQSVVQPMDHGISAAFRLHYLRHLLEQLVREVDGDNKESLREFWHDYTIKRAVNNIKMAWDDVTAATLNAAWQSIWPECVQGPTSHPLLKVPTEQDVLCLAHQAGFLQVTIADIEDLLKSPCEELTSEEIFQMELDDTLPQHMEQPEMEAVKTLDINLLSHTLGLLDEAMAVLEQNDPNCTRSCDMRSCVERGIKGYRELYATKKRKAQNSSIFCAHFN